MSHNTDVVIEDPIGNQGHEPNPGNEHGGAEANPTLMITAAILFMIGILIINEIFLNYLKKLQKESFGCFKYINATMVTTLIGLLAGCLIKYGLVSDATEQLKDKFSDIFLIILLPPIIFESAINMQSELFFKHIGTILNFAVPGTSIATALTAYLLFNIRWFGIHLEIPLLVCIAFGSLISATDPVAVLNIFKTLNADKMLYIIIFGESILNDAIAIIFYETTVEIFHAANITIGQGVNQFLYIMGGSIGVGFGIGLFCAAILKSEKRAARDEVDNIETIVTVTVPWASYLVAFHLKLSGIVSIMFCGIAMARYALPNLSKDGLHMMHLFYHALGYCFENLTFIFCGIVFVTYGLPWDMLSWYFFLVISIILIFARFVNTAVISFLQNINRSKNRITIKHFLVLWYSGFRGAMATALSLSAVLTFKDGRFGELFLVLTLCTAGFNIFIQGIFLEPVMNACGVIGGSPHEDYEEMEDLQPESQGFIKTVCSAIDQKIFWEYFVIKPKDDHQNSSQDIELTNRHHH